MKTPLVSIIMPVYNASRFLALTLESVFAQSYSNFELIIINDGSTDNSEQIINRYADKRIKYYYQSNKGQAAASNFGLSTAAGKYIKFLDADDIINAKHLAALVDRLAGSDTAIASCAWGRFHGELFHTVSLENEAVNADLLPLDWLKKALSQKADMMAAWRWLLPRTLLLKTGGWNEQLSLNNDFEFSTRLILESEQVLFCPDAHLYYRSGVEGSLSLTISEKAYHDAYLSTFLACSYLLKAENSAFIKRLCANRYQLWIFRMYPLYPALIAQFEAQVKKLGGSHLKLDGGRFLKITSAVLGWKTAKKMKLIKYKIFRITNDLSYKIT